MHVSRGGIVWGGGGVKLDANCQLCFSFFFFRHYFESFRNTARGRETESDAG